MDHREIDLVLTEVEQALAGDVEAGVRGRGFWPAVEKVKRDPELVEAFAERIADIDLVAFERWALLSVPLGIGTLSALIITGFGLTLVAMAFGTEPPANGILLLAGMLVCFTALHSVAHVLVGRALGIRFSGWFVGGFPRIQPGAKIDYATYLRTAPARRAWMHASGALMSKAVPFLLIPAAVAAEVPGWTLGALVGFGVVTIASDVLLSVKSGDWKKFQREMALHRAAPD